MDIEQKQFIQEQLLKQARSKDDWYVKRDLVWHRFDEIFKRHPELKQVFADKAREENDDDNPDICETWIFDEFLTDYSSCLTEADKSSFDFCGEDTKYHFKSYCEEL